MIGSLKFQGLVLGVWEIGLREREVGRPSWGGIYGKHKPPLCFCLCKVAKVLNSSKSPQLDNLKAHFIGFGIGIRNSCHVGWQQTWLAYQGKQLKIYGTIDCADNCM